MALPSIRRAARNRPPKSPSSADDFDVLKQNEGFILENLRWSQDLEERLLRHGLLDGDCQVNIALSVLIHYVG